MGIGGCENKFHIRRWFFQCFKKRVKRLESEHVRLINDIYFVAAFCWYIIYVFTQLTNIFNSTVGGSIYLDNICRCVLIDFSTVFTSIARVPIVGIQAVDSPC